MRGRFMNVKRLLGGAGARVLLSSAAMTALPAAAMASHHDYDHDRNRDRGGHVDFRITDSYNRSSETHQVWVEPVYRTVCDRGWVAPVYRTVTDRVWVGESTQKVTDRAWVPEHTEKREVKHRTYWGERVTSEYVRVPGHYEDRCREVCVPAHWENVTRQELVCDGHWENVERQELVSPGHWEQQRIAVAPRHDEGHARIELRFPF